MDACAYFNFLLIPEQQVTELVQSDESPRSSLYLPPLRSYILGVVRSSRKHKAINHGEQADWQIHSVFVLTPEPCGQPKSFG